MGKKRIRSGERRQRVTIQTAADAESGTAAANRTYTTVRTVNARVTNVSKQVVDDRGNTLAVTDLINIRWQPNITVKNFLLYNGIRYAIAAVSDPTQYRQELDIDCYMQEKNGTYTNPSPTAVPSIP